MKESRPLQIIAEFAQGFEGEYFQARMLLRAAAAAQATAGKFQLVFADELATQDYKYYGLFKSLEMPHDSWLLLSEYAKELGLELHLDVFGERSLQLAESIGASAIKLHPTDLNNVALLDAVGKCGVREIYIGAGGASEEEIALALGMMKDKSVTLVLGFQGYPTNTQDNHIGRLNAWKMAFSDHKKVKFGFADHSAPETRLAWGLSAMSIMAGATALEKHLTLAAAMKLEDYESALEPNAFSDFVVDMNQCLEAIGQSTSAGRFGMSQSELQYRQMIRRHVVANTDLKAGTDLKASHLVLKRTAESNPIMDLGSVIGKVLRQSVKAGQALTLGHISEKA